MQSRESEELRLEASPLGAPRKTSLGFWSSAVFETLQGGKARPAVSRACAYAAISSTAGQCRSHETIQITRIDNSSPPLLGQITGTRDGAAADVRRTPHGVGPTLPKSFLKVAPGQSGCRFRRWRTKHGLQLPESTAERLLR